MVQSEYDWLRDRLRARRNALESAKDFLDQTFADGREFRVTVQRAGLPERTYSILDGPRSAGARIGED
jgi:hypothetical protein